jgi:hypothetical protein
MDVKTTFLHGDLKEERERPFTTKNDLAHKRVLKP